MAKNLQLDYGALDTRPYSCNSRSQFLGHVNPMAGYNPHCPGVNFDHRIGATSTLAFWTISLINDRRNPGNAPSISTVQIAIFGDENRISDYLVPSFLRENSRIVFDNYLNRNRHIVITERVIGFRDCMRWTRKKVEQAIPTSRIRDRSI